MSQRQRGWRENVGGPAGIALPSENVEDDVSGVDALDDRLSAGGFDRRQSVGEHRGEDVDHLPIAVIDASELAPYALHRGWQHPILEGSAVAQGAWLAGEHRDVVPRVVERIPAAERAGMFGDDPPVLTDHDAVRIGMNFDGTPDRAGSDRVFVVVEPYQAANGLFLSKAISFGETGSDTMTTCPKTPANRIVQSWDIAMMTGDANDYSVCTTWQMIKADYYLSTCSAPGSNTPTFGARLRVWQRRRPAG